MSGRLDRGPLTARFKAAKEAVVGKAEHAFDDRSRYFSRELSWLEFNRRVLEEAQDPTKPLLERAKFLAIVSSNLDEFVMVRLAEVHGMTHGRGIGGDVLPETTDAPQLLGEMRAEIRRLVADQCRCWRDDLVPALLREGYELVPPGRWDDTDRESLRTFFRNQLEPVLTPLGVDPGKPFPVLANRGLTVAVRLAEVVEGTTLAKERRALVAVPSGVRLVALVDKSGRFALVEDVVSEFVDTLFPGFRILGRCLFRVTRDGALDIDENQASDLLSEIEQELSSREHSHAVRIEADNSGDADLRAWLVEAMGLDADDCYVIDGLLDYTVLFALADKLDRPDLRDRPLPVTTYPQDWQDPFARIRAGDLLLHHPFQGFQRVVELVEQAADDPTVLALKQTLYRVSSSSPIVRALVRAAKSGKQVTVLIELKARFDEAANIRWARALEEAGAHVVYGLVGLKVHSKLLLIIRREEDGIRRYCHIGTGNYNDKTARLYTDLSYLTCNEAVGRDVAGLFNMLTGYSQPPEWERLAVAPLSMRKRFVEWIRREAEHAREAKARGEGAEGGRIVAKFNSLVDQGICDELYAASQAGVEIELIVRGMCILRPGVPGLSDNIRVRSLVGRLLEHSRIYWFANRGRPVVAIASADWMTRNLDRRVECLVRIEDEALRERLISILRVCWEDNVQARELLSDGTYRRVKPAAGQPLRSAIDRLLAEGAACERPLIEDDISGPRFVPRRKGG